MTCQSPVYCSAAWPVFSSCFYTWHSLSGRSGTIVSTLTSSRRCTGEGFCSCL